MLSLCTLPCPPLTPSPPSVTPSSPSTAGSGPPEHADRDLPQSPAPAHQQVGGCSAGQQQQHSLLAQLVFSGATNGSIAAWRVIDTHSRVCTQQHQHQQGSLVWSEERWHQSGVNAMHAAVTPGRTAASAGICATWFQFLCVPDLCLCLVSVCARPLFVSSLCFSGPHGYGRIASQRTHSIRDCLHLIGMQCTMHFKASSITLRGRVTTDDATLKVHVSISDDKLDGHLCNVVGIDDQPTHQQAAERKTYQLGPCVSFGTPIDCRSVMQMLKIACL